MTLIFSPERYTYHADTMAVRFNATGPGQTKVAFSISRNALEDYARVPSGAGSDEEAVRIFLRNRGLIDAAATMLFSEGRVGHDGVTNIVLADLERAHSKEGRP